MNDFPAPPVVRLAHAEDVPALADLAARAGFGMTTFKPDADALRARMDRVARSVAGTATEAERGFLFVLEDGAGGEVAGVCGLEAAVGLDQPFYTYRVGIMVHASRELGTWTRMPTLYLSHDLTGYAELCSLFLHPERRAKSWGALLSKSRFLFMAQFPDRFPARVCAEMRGHYDADGRSPFWEGLGRHFFHVDIHEADRLVAAGRKAFLAELMPRHPVYLDLLPPEARAVVAVTHADTLPARRMLEAEGLRYEHHIDIFEAGPVLEAHVADLRAARESRLVRARLRPDAGTGGVPHLVARPDWQDFRVTLATGSVEDGGDGPAFALPPRVADRLGVADGDAVRVMTLHPAPPPAGLRTSTGTGS